MDKRWLTAGLCLLIVLGLIRIFRTEDRRTKEDEARQAILQICNVQCNREFPPEVVYDVGVSHDGECLCAIRLGRTSYPED